MSRTFSYSEYSTFLKFDLLRYTAFFLAGRITQKGDINEAHSSENEELSFSMPLASARVPRIPPVGGT
jgi:hypothetical protein